MVVVVDVDRFYSHPSDEKDVEEEACMYGTEQSTIEMKKAWLCINQG
jgi:hypothetical protein